MKGINMKVIDLLNKIANGEEVPKKIKYRDRIYTYEEFNIGYGKDYFEAEWKIEKGYRANLKDTFLYFNIHDYCLNDEVEIIEDTEEKKIEKIETVKNVKGETCIKLYENGDSNVLSVPNIRMIDKINELIEEVNKLKK